MIYQSHKTKFRVMQTITMMVCIAIAVSPVAKAVETSTTENTEETTITSTETFETTTTTEVTVPTITTTVTQTPPTTTETPVVTTASTAPSQTTPPTTAPTSVQLPGSISDADRDFVLSLHEQRLSLQQQAQALENSRLYYSNSLDGLLLQQQSIASEINLKQQEIGINTQIKNTIEMQITVNDEEIIEQEQASLVRRQTLLTQYDSLRTQLRAVSKIGEFSVYLKLLDAKSYPDLLVNNKMIERLSNADTDLFLQLESEMDDIEAEYSLLEERNALLDEQLAPYVSAEQTLEASQRELLALLAESDNIASQLSTFVNYYRDAYDQLVIEQSNLRNQITEIIGGYDSAAGLYAAESMSWPAPECTVITSSFKSRWGRWHYGTDIAAWGDSTGLPIVAAADGVVIFSGNDNSGYGNYVMIDHGYDLDGKRIITLYGHCSELYAQVGETVIAGQSHIAAIGNTGNSFGAHLHFEVRVNGSAVDAVANGYLSTDGITVAG